MKLSNIRRTLGISFALIMLLTSASVTAQQLLALNVNPFSAQKNQLQFKFSENVSVYREKFQYNPTQLIIDIPNSTSAMHVNPVDIAKSGIKHVYTKSTSAGLSIKINLYKLMPYQVFKQGKYIIVNFGEAPNKIILSAQESAIAAAILQNGDFGKTEQANNSKQNQQNKSTSKESIKGVINNISNIDFQRGRQGQGKLFVYLDNANIAVDLHRRGSKLIVDFKSTGIPKTLLYVMDVVDFATVVNSVETFSDNRTARLEINIKGDFDYRSEQIDNQLIIDISKKEKTSKANSKYQGKAISLNFQDIPVRTVLQLIADFNGMNLVISDSVNGNITLRLDDVPWRQALDLILKVRGLDKRIDGNVLMIAPASEIAAKDRTQLESDQQAAKLAPLYSEFIQINYAKAADIAAMLSTEKASLLSERGSVSVDERTNTLLVKDTTVVIDRLKEMLEVLDIAVRQVVIEARMVTVSDSVGEDLGVQWSGITETGNTLNTLGVNLPISSPAGTLGIQVAKLADGNILDLQLTALEQESKAEIIASPRITTLNQQTAYIEQGTEIPYVESASSGATSVSFKKAVLSLEVTPQITPDNKLILSLTITQDSVGETISTSTGEAVSIDTQEISTQVLVDNGETLVLGGIYQQQVTDTVNKVPILGDIPYLGFFFRNTIKDSSKSELLIFVTPRIVMQ
ncbi:type IV pilus secretin PilQ family protein [Psychromonas aquatilis]|uniref:Type IV pilus secretin PilQ family protein n=1 Tax=Psychromonas aquatilis TaxID=2005072 RepID=A0ABU9GM49_9GAMM